jgi:hypothetical protein
VAFSRDGARLASASHDQTVKLWDVASGRLLRTLTGHKAFIHGVAWSPDGARLASAGGDRMVKIWDAATGQELRTLRRHTSWVSGVAFSPNGDWLASVGGDGIRLWDARPLTPDVRAEVTAVALLDLLFARPLPKSEVLAAVRRDKILSRAACQKALELAERYHEETDPKKYHASAWPVIRHPHANRFVCRFALAQTKAACERAPGDATYRLALGIAQYRLGRFEKGRYQEALATLARCDNKRPATLAFLAMAQMQLGDRDAARAALAQLRKIIKVPLASQPDAQAFLREAAELIDRPAHP